MYFTSSKIAKLFIHRKDISDEWQLVTYVFNILLAALNTIIPPDLSQQIGVRQQAQPHFTNEQNLGSARPVEVIVGVDLNTGTKNTNSEYHQPVQQPIVHRGSSFDHKIKPGPTIRPSASPVRYVFHLFSLLKKNEWKL